MHGKKRITGGSITTYSTSTPNIANLITASHSHRYSANHITASHMSGDPYMPIEAQAPTPTVTCYARQQQLPTSKSPGPSRGATHHGHTNGQQGLHDAGGIPVRPSNLSARGTPTVTQTAKGPRAPREHKVVGVEGYHVRVPAHDGLHALQERRGEGGREVSLNLAAVWSAHFKRGGRGRYARRMLCPSMISLQHHCEHRLQSTLQEAHRSRCFAHWSHARARTMPPRNTWASGPRAVRPDSPTRTLRNLVVWMRRWSCNAHTP